MQLKYGMVTDLWVILIKIVWRQFGGVDLRTVPMFCDVCSLVHNITSLLIWSCRIMVWYFLYLKNITLISITGWNNIYLLQIKKLLERKECSNWEITDVHQCSHSVRVCVLSFTELTPEQQKMLIDIRRRKTELLLEIQVGQLLWTYFVL
jgi:hypothetical protein